MKTSPPPINTPPAPIPPEPEPLVDTIKKEEPGPKTIGPLEVTPPKQEYEWEETGKMTDGSPDPKVEQAYEDVKHGLKDTGRGPPSGRTYEKLKK